MTDILDLLARWTHVFAGIMWVGNSLLFNWLDRNLVSHPDQTPSSLRSEGKQSIWLLHSGGFYFVDPSGRESLYGEMFALSTPSLVPAFPVVLPLQRLIIRGLALGSLKR
jgi:ABC-type glycerol-3-phosphate transport system permease component